jgi:hypothetical protein
MKNFIFFLLILFNFTIVYAQKIYSTSQSYKADLKVYVVENEYQADLKVFKVSRPYEAKEQQWPLVLFQSAIQFR